MKTGEVELHTERQSSPLARGVADAPLISIVTPNYNYAGFIGETIESVVAQDYDNVEHIIVDDGSTDDSVAVIEEYVRRYPGKVRLIAQSNAGQTAAVNAGLRQARGTVLGWINSDDTYCPGAFSKAMEQFRADPDLDIVYGDFNVIDPAGRLVYRFRKPRFGLFVATLVGYGSILTSNAMFWSARAMRSAGWLDESLNYAMDSEFFWRLTRGARIKKIDVSLANWRSHPRAKTVVYHSDRLEKYERERQELLRRYYEDYWLSRYIPYRYAAIPRLAARGYLGLAKLLNGNYGVRAHDLVRYRGLTRSDSEGAR